MSQASHDANHVPTLLGVSSVDSKTPTPIAVNPTTGALLIDKTSLGALGGGGLFARVATLVVAASNSKDTKDADYVCTGTNDDVTILAALAALPTSGGRVILREGDYYIGAEVNISASNKILEGQGAASIIHVANSANIRSAVAITGTNTIYVKLKNFVIDGNKANQTSGSGIYLKTPGSSFAGHVLEDILVQNCINDGIKADNNAGTSSVYFLRCRATNCNGNGFNIYQDANGSALTDSVFDTCIADTNAFNGFYLGCLDTHLTNCKSYYNGSATGNYHGYYIAGYNNYFISSEAQDNYQSGFYSQNDGDATYGSQNCILVDCDADSNNQSQNGSYGAGFHLKSVTGWMLFGCQAYVRPYASSWGQRLGVSLEGTTAQTQITNLQGTGNSSALYSNTASGAGNVLYGLNAGGTRIIIDGGSNDFEWDNMPELFWNHTNPDISLYSGSDNRLDVLNGGGGKGNFHVQNQLTFGYGDYLGVSPNSSWPSGTHKLLEVTFNGSNDQVDIYTPGGSRANSLMTLTSNGVVQVKSNAELDLAQGSSFRCYSDGNNGFILDGSQLSPTKNVWNIKQGSDGTFLFDQSGSMNGRFKLGGTSSSYFFDWTPDYATSYFIVKGDKSVATANNTLDDGSGNSALKGTVSKYNNISTAGKGIPAIYGYGRSTAQTAAVASVATYTVGVSDGSFLVSGNVLVTASTTHSFNLQVSYTDEGGTARTATMNVQQLGGTFVTSITNVTGVGPYEGVPLHIRAKASTAITILTSGTFTSVTYNVEGAITQLA